MIAKLLLAFAILLVQETITFTSVIFSTHRGLYPVIVIHLLFLLATLIDIGVGYFVGSFFKKKFPKSRFARFMDKAADKLSLRKEKYRRWLALLILGNFSFPWINACIAGYLELPFWESAFFNFLGDIFWYASIWMIAIGASALFKNFFTGLVVAVAAALGIAVLIGIIKSRKSYGREK